MACVPGREVLGTTVNMFVQGPSFHPERKVLTIVLEGEACIFRSGDSAAGLVGHPHKGLILPF